MAILLYITANQKMEHENTVTSYVYEKSLYLLDATGIFKF